MSAEITLEQIVAEASLLSPQDRAEVLAQIQRLSTKPRRRITELKGLGKEIWNGQDAQDYVDAERDPWNR